ncbi:hypothetical protein [Clostridium sp. DJ247]|uniref:hypothetical protein n=1 Tax=Clostridium sp. DJ247 TaxID=2726188 RepID=UPI001628BEAC|nr:hypothetical protein [Clostridium sp. DJ247]MBC2578761.1 hypothetical protein [Clostridium sp. DJ247]
MVIEKYPLQVLIIESLCFLLISLYIIHIGATPFYILLMGLYASIAKKPIEYCRAMKSSNKLQLFGCYVIVLFFAMSVIWYIEYLGELEIQRYINSHK